MPGSASLSASFGSEYGGSLGSGLSIVAGEAGSPVLAGDAAFFVIIIIWRRELSSGCSSYCHCGQWRQGCGWS